MKSFKKVAFSLALSLLLFSSSVSANSLNGMCIGLVHGILGFDDTKGLANRLVKIGVV